MKKCSSPNGDSQSITDKINPVNSRDLWIELYLIYIDREMRSLNAGMIARHYRNCVGAFAAEYQRSRSESDRFRAWMGIQTCMQWICQLRSLN
jgi:hypothetical protein